MAQRAEAMVVAVLDSDGRTPIGTGIVAHRDGYIITAYHVLQLALNLKAEDEMPEGASVSLRFPNSNVENRATLVEEYSSIANDVATLSVKSLPATVEVAIFGASRDCVGDKFVSVGYRQAIGGAVGFIAPPQPEPVWRPFPYMVLNSDQVDRGMSGAPVLDLEQDRVVGMVSSTWYSDPSKMKDQSTSFAIPSEAIKEVFPLLMMRGAESSRVLQSLHRQKAILDNLPLERTRYFVGRSADKEKIMQYMRREGTVLLLAGPSGIGKTTLALEVARSFLEADGFTAIIWVSTEIDPELTLDILLGNIADLFSFTGFNRLQASEKKLQIRSFLRAERTLLIVDGAEKVQDRAVFDFLVQLPRHCSLLITSQSTSVFEECESVRLGEFNRSEAQELIKVYSKGKRLEQISVESLGEIYNACGGLPLALSWAIGQINSGRQTLEALTERVTSGKELAIYDRLFEDTYRKLSDIERKIIQTIAIAVGEVSKEAVAYTVEVDEPHLAEPLMQLVDMNLVYPNGHFEEKLVRFTIHPMLQNYVLHRLDISPEVRNTLVARYIRYFSDLIARNEYESLDLNSIRITLDWCSRYQSRRFIELIYILSYYFFEQGLWEERVKWAEKALNMSKSLSDHKAQVWMLINELGYMSMQLGHYDDAEAYIEQGLDLTKREIALLRKQGLDSKDAEDKFGFHFMQGLGLRYTGILKSRQHQYQAAEAHFEAALAVFNHLQRRSIIANQQIEMAELAYLQKDYNSAEALFQESLQYHSDQCETKPWVRSWMARACYGLGDIAFEEGQLTESMALYRESLTLANESGNQPAIAEAKRRLSIVYEKQRRYQESLEVAEQALRLYVNIGDSASIKLMEESLQRVENLIGSES